MEAPRKILTAPFTRPLVPRHPPYFFDQSVHVPAGSAYAPITIPVKCGGYARVNFVVYAEGQPGDDFYLLVDFQVPGQFEMQITNLGSDTIQPWGTQVLQIAEYRPMMPNFSVVIASMAQAVFKKFCVTVYATMA